MRAGGWTLRGLILAEGLAALAMAPGSRVWAHGARQEQGRPAPAGPLFERSDRFDFEPPRPGTYRLPAIRPAPDGAVVDAAGAPRRLRDVMEGKISLVSFIYTGCTDGLGCPLATAVLHGIAKAGARDRDLAKHLRLISLSFDGRRDTPAVMARYGRRLGARGGKGPAVQWAFLTTASARDLAPILEGYGQVVVRPPEGEAGDLSHLLRVYLVDRRGTIRNIYGLELLDPRLLIADVHTLLLEERGVTP